MKIFKRLENIFSAVAFAEAGEHETARQILRENDEEGVAGRGEAKPQCKSEHENISHSPSKA